ncbi:hypothetical protein BDY17DRAFT_310440 [Neohortaea acidophila]|uniref:Knr4/Smi1-like domain-containing protein n=1 Tax=Neohortaea acidophila TaxID=245834 RepID=A0A6A6PUQ5_9PEZI|nr:uncharacterized protein BDY17DRAFT_310440 [Neohortaea acidophila]KAF2483431.1 hypothetical protein BDY17DRAFT_310440 [Neohortaea acidophila]
MLPPDVTPDAIRQEPNISRVETELNSCAFSFALLGRIDVAKQLAEILYEHGATQGRRALHSCLKFAWRESSQWPKGGPLDNYGVSSDEADPADRDESSVDVVEGDDGDDRARLDELLGVEDNGFSDAVTGYTAMEKSRRLVDALELSVKLHRVEPQPKSAGRELRSKRAKAAEGQATPQTEPETQFKVSDLDAESADILTRIVVRLHANSQVSYLGDTKSLWPFYVRGLLADAVDVSQEEMEEKGRGLIEAFKDRFQHGSAVSRFAGKTVEELLEIGDETTRETLHALNEKEDDDEHKQTVPESLFNAPATDEEIAQLEKKLGIALPDDFKAFLKISNGFGQDEENGMANDECPHPALHGTSAVHWVEENYFVAPVALLQLPTEYEELVGTEKKSSQVLEGIEFDTAFPLFDRVLEVGTRDIDSLWLVQPDLVKQCVAQYGKMYDKADEKQKKIIVRAMESFAGSKEAFESSDWCFVDSSAGGAASMSFYASFTHYLRHVVEELVKTG